jgi:hypothetical protein
MNDCHQSSVEIAARSNTKADLQQTTHDANTTLSPKTKHVAIMDSVSAETCETQSLA